MDCSTSASRPSVNSGASFLDEIRPRFVRGLQMGGPRERHAQGRAVARRVPRRRPRVDRARCLPPRARARSDASGTPTTDQRRGHPADRRTDHFSISDPIPTAAPALPTFLRRCEYGSTIASTSRSPSGRDASWSPPTLGFWPTSSRRSPSSSIWRRCHDRRHRTLVHRHRLPWRMFLRPPR